jgi:hypothetical protein
MNRKENILKRKTVQKALKQALLADTDPGLVSGDLPEGQGSEVSLLMHDIFGGEILKTPGSRGWHFYNRIQGERIYFAGSELGRCRDDRSFADIPSSPAETTAYFEQEDYTNFFVRFIRAFEEAIGLTRKPN